MECTKTESTTDFSRESFQTLRYLNNAHSITRELPAEILVIIFHHASEPDKSESHMSKTLNLLNFSAVCFQWRQIITLSSQLWVSIDIKSGDTVNHVELLRLHFENVGRRTLAIRIDFSWGSKAPKSIDRILEIIFNEHPSKVGALALVHITNRPWITIKALAPWTNFDSLKAIELSWAFPYDRDLPYLEGCLFYNSPNLRQITISTYLPGIEEHLPWLLVTSVNLGSFPWVNALRVLIPSLHLTEFQLKPFGSMPLFPLWVWPHCLTFHRIQKFGWRSYGEAADAALFQGFRFPCVRELFWDGTLISTPQQRIKWTSFFSCMTNVTVLECTYRGKNTRRLWALFPNLHELRIQHIADPDLAKDCLERLVVYQHGQNSLFPRLKLLRIALSSQFRDGTFVVPILKLLYSRRNAPLLLYCSGLAREWDPEAVHWQSHSRLEGFYLSQDMVSIHWADVYLEKLEHLVKQGLHVEFTVGWRRRVVELF